MRMLNDYLPFDQLEPMMALTGDEVLPEKSDKKYVMYEFYCSNVVCDCQYVVISFMEVGQNYEHITHRASAKLNYCWSEKDSEPIPSPEYSSQSELMPALLKAYAKLTKDPDYVKRIKSHYRRVKELSFLEDQAQATNKTIMPNRTIEKKSALSLR